MKQVYAIRSRCSSSHCDCLAFCAACSESEALEIIMNKTDILELFDEDNLFATDTSLLSTKDDYLYIFADDIGYTE